MKIGNLRKSLDINKHGSDYKYVIWDPIKPSFM